MYKYLLILVLVGIILIFSYRKTIILESYHENGLDHVAGYVKLKKDDGSSTNNEYSQDNIYIEMLSGPYSLQNFDLKDLNFE